MGGRRGAVRRGVARRGVARRASSGMSLLRSLPRVLHVGVVSRKYGTPYRWEKSNTAALSQGSSGRLGFDPWEDILAGDQRLKQGSSHERYAEAAVCTMVHGVWTSFQFR